MMSYPFFDRFCSCYSLRAEYLFKFAVSSAAAEIRIGHRTPPHRFCRNGSVGAESPAVIASDNERSGAVIISVNASEDLFRRIATLFFASTEQSRGQPGHTDDAEFSDFHKSPG